MLAYRSSRTDFLTPKQGIFSYYWFADQNFNSWWGATSRKQTQTHHQQACLSGPNFGNSPQTLCSLTAQLANHGSSPLSHPTHQTLHKDCLSLHSFPYLKTALLLPRRLPLEAKQLYNYISSFCFPSQPLCLDLQSFLVLSCWSTCYFTPPNMHRHSSEERLTNRRGFLLLPHRRGLREITTLHVAERLAQP